MSHLEAAHFQTNRVRTPNRFSQLGGRGQDQQRPSPQDSGEQLPDVLRPVEKYARAVKSKRAELINVKSKDLTLSVL